MSQWGGGGGGAGALDVSHGSDPRWGHYAGGCGGAGAGAGACVDQPDAGAEPRVAREPLEQHRRSAPLRELETCPVSTGGGTRRVQSVREGGGAAPPSRARRPARPADGDYLPKQSAPAARRLSAAARSGAARGEGTRRVRLVRGEGRGVST